MYVKTDCFVVREQPSFQITFFSGKLKTMGDSPIDPLDDDLIPFINDCFPKFLNNLE